MTKNKIVAVGMSGGVDSTMAAFILKNRGYEVIGLTMKIWDDNPLVKGNRSGCYGPGEAKDIATAKYACKILNIPHYVIDLKEEYQKNVLKYFKEEYQKGKTPNPCVVCNAKIKFGFLIEKAMHSGIKFDYFATGHYCRVFFDKKSKLCILKKGLDKNKDQSYFLHRLKQSQLKKLIFPLGVKKKEDIKKLAKKNGFQEFANKPESQNFVECDSYSALLPKGQSGYIVDHTGKILGEHKGIINYTLGQRKNLNIGGLPEPYYVLKIDAIRNTIVAGPKKLAYSDKVSVKKVNWIVPFENAPEKIKAKIRYGAKDANAVFTIKEKNKVELKFLKPQFAVTPGQSIVFYNKDIVLGGGIIKK
ncbi:MAG: tRNA 2-thiouridine(34) synthase MnmA [Candidatus Pacebacteria bacterium]|nr:tRNA 2-thiouridine(34) synthase MnmA [Candidatus Paceibacterota bacterium]